MTNNLILLTKKLVSLYSPSDDKKSLEKILNFALSNLRGYTIEKFNSNGAKSALIYNLKKRPKKFKIILNGHLDVIPGKKHQQTSKVKGNKLYGAGSMDMKAGVACLITTFKEVANKINYPIALQLVTDEEIGGFNGTKHQVDKGVRTDFVIAGEPTNFDIVNKAKGVLWLKIYTKGKTAHSAYPWRGDNAILKMNEFISILDKKYPIPKKEIWKTTVNVSSIETSNKTFNKIPDDCAVYLDIRYIPSEKDVVLNNIKKLLPEGLKLEVVVKEPTMFVDSKNEYIIKLKKSAEKVNKKRIILRGANGSSDTRHFARVGCVGVEFGPIGGGIGSDNEWVDIPSLEKYCQILKFFLASLSS